MKRVLTFREHAQACRELASQMTDPHRSQLEAMAREWETMAAERDASLNHRAPEDPHVVP